MLVIGIDSSEDHHDIEIQSGSGKGLKELRVKHGVEGLRRFHEVVADLEPEPSQVVIGIESDHGLWVNALVASGYRVYPINPLTSARARERPVTGQSQVRPRGCTPAGQPGAYQSPTIAAASRG